MVTVTIMEHAYKMTTPFFHNLLNIAKEKYEKDNVNAIYCITRKGVAEMKNDVYPSKEELTKAVKAYQRRGFKTYKTEEKK